MPAPAGPTTGPDFKPRTGANIVHVQYHTVHAYVGGNCLRLPHAPGLPSVVCLPSPIIRGRPPYNPNPLYEVTIKHLTYQPQQRNQLDFTPEVH